MSDIRITNEKANPAHQDNPTPALMSLLSILVLTHNEELHIERCLRSALRLTRNVFVLDSKSSDDTVVLARKFEVHVMSGDFQGFADKLNWAIMNVPIPTPWTLRLDADELLSEELVEKLPHLLSQMATEVSGIYLRRQLWFMGKWIRHGGMYPTYSMRLWRHGTAICEHRALDEHMILRSGRAVTLNLDIIDDPLFSLARWIQKHNGYSTSEANTIVNASDNHLVKPNLLGTPPQRKRWLKINVFYRLPPFMRPILYFFYRYIIRMGFLDGRIGFIFHFMHGLWYRCLVDAKIMEKKIGRTR